MDRHFVNFSEFYPFYLSEHSTVWCKRMHFAGDLLVLWALSSFLFSMDPVWLLLAPVLGYGLAWIGHFVFEKNRPATFRYPLYSLAGDWKMFVEIMAGRQSLR